MTSYHVRRADKEITDQDKLRSILKSTKYVTIALSKDNQPYLVTLSHGYDEKRDCIYFHCATEGKKIDYLRSNNRVWGQAFIDHGYDEGQCNHLYSSVHFSGKVSFIEEPEEKVKAMQCMMRQLEKKPEPMMKTLTIEKLKDALMGRIDIDYMSGKQPEKKGK
jgi:nitroimidazol reductase NimA-like FMN-containing flavoprotein (pyridoxamine 5'-phosphate oxidase superfamily)